MFQSVSPPILLNKLQHHSARVAATDGRAQKRCLGEGLPCHMSYCHTLRIPPMQYLFHLFHLISTTSLKTKPRKPHRICHRTRIRPCSILWRCPLLQQLVTLPHASASNKLSGTRPGSFQEHLQHPSNVCTHPHCRELLDLVGLSYFETLKCSASLCAAFPAGRASKCEGVRNIQAARLW